MIVGVGAALAADASRSSAGSGRRLLRERRRRRCGPRRGRDALAVQRVWRRRSIGLAGSGVRVTSGGFARIAGNGAIAAGSPGGAPYSVFADPTSSAVVHLGAALSHPISGAVITGAVPLPVRLGRRDFGGWRRAAGDVAGDRDVRRRDPDGSLPLWCGPQSLVLDRIRIRTPRRAPDPRSQRPHVRRNARRCRDGAVRTHAFGVGAMVGRCADLHTDRRVGRGRRQTPHVELPRASLQALTTRLPGSHVAGASDGSPGDGARTHGRVNSMG